MLFGFSLCLPVVLLNMTECIWQTLFLYNLFFFYTTSSLLPSLTPLSSLSSLHLSHHSTSPFLHPPLHLYSSWMWFPPFCQVWYESGDSLSSKALKQAVLSHIQLWTAISPKTKAILFFFFPQAHHSSARGCSTLTLHEGIWKISERMSQLPLTDHVTCWSLKSSFLPLILP